MKWILLEAMDMWDVPEEVLVKMAVEGKLKSRRADGAIYFLRNESTISLIEISRKHGLSPLRDDA
jgi:hypothetical protein